MPARFPVLSDGRKPHYASNLCTVSMNNAGRQTHGCHYVSKTLYRSVFAKILREYELEVKDKGGDDDWES